MYRFDHQGLLGTVVELRLGPAQPAGKPGAHAGTAGSGQEAGTEAGPGWLAEDDAEALFDEALIEIERLQRLFSAFDPDSELSRWRRGKPGPTSAEFARLMADVLVWQDRTGGAFNPAVGRVSALWSAAEAADRPPPPDEIAAAVAAITLPCFTLVDGRPVLQGAPCPAFSLNAMAKGFIVDRTLDHLEARARELELNIGALLLNAGGDVCHRGTNPVPVGIENPLRPYDNEPPLAVIELQERAVATSGGSRRGFRIGGRRYSHLIDPRAGYPIDYNRRAAAAVSILAPDAATADVVATAAAVMGPRDALDWVNGLDGIEGLIIDDEGVRTETDGWPR